MSISYEKMEVLAGASLLRGPNKYLDFRLSVRLSGSHHVPRPRGCRETGYPAPRNRPQQARRHLCLPPPRAWAHSGGARACADRGGAWRGERGRGLRGRREEARGSDANAPPVVGVFAPLVCSFWIPFPRLRRREAVSQVRSRWNGSRIPEGRRAAGLRGTGKQGLGPGEV